MPRAGPGEAITVIKITEEYELVITKSMIEKELLDDAIEE